ncbi:hypothetical protein ABC270_14075 [Curtobacterium sp. 1P10AnD]|uniref:hypothetical protein n=1 Tax=Curtobacterium sp. 1P10AnD TaxID=3132283 RepID=UPI0039A2A76A
MHRAYCDESEPGGGLDHSTYILAAVVVDDSERDSLRRTVERLRPARMRKLHWYEAIEVQRHTWRGLLRLAVATIIVRYDGAPARAERRRRRCLERLVFELESRAVRHVTIESRGPALDRADRRVLDAFRTQGAGRSIVWDHARGDAEPLLALADIACGARGTLRDEHLDVTEITVA